MKISINLFFRKKILLPRQFYFSMFYFSNLNLSVANNEGIKCRERVQAPEWWVYFLSFVLFKKLVFFVDLKWKKWDNSSRKKAGKLGTWWLSMWQSIRRVSVVTNILLLSDVLGCAMVFSDRGRKVFVFVVHNTVSCCILFTFVCNLMREVFHLRNPMLKFIDKCTLQAIVCLCS